LTIIDKAGLRLGFRLVPALGKKNPRCVKHADFDAAAPPENGDARNM